MDETEFDKVAEEYKTLHQGVIGISGESSAFFSEYKVQDAVHCIRSHNLARNSFLLDFGSGIGESVPYFKKYLPECRLVGLDVSRKSLIIARRRFGEQSTFVSFDGESIPFGTNSFDVVFTACVFHHIPPGLHERMLGEINRVLKPDGLLIAFEHNPYNFLTVKAVNSCSFDENAVLIRGNDFRRLLRTNGYKKDKLRYRIFFPAMLKLMRPLEKFMYWIPLGAQYYVYARKSV